MGRLLEPSVAARALVPIVQRLTSQGVDTALLLARRDIDAALLGDDEARLPLSKTRGIWEEAAQLCSDDAFGLHLAESSQAASFGLFSYLAVTSATWGFALRRVCTYYGLISDASGYDVEDDGQLVTVRARAWPQVPYSRQVTEFSLAVLCCYARATLAQPLLIASVHFPHAKPADTCAHQRIFQSRIHFEQDAAAMRFESRFLQVPLHSADAKLATLLEPGAKSELEKLDASQGDVALSLRPLLARAVRRSGTPSLEDIARQLAVSPRTLQRQLSEVGTSFRQLLGEAQSAWAAELLLEPSLGTAEVAALLGFSETAAFHRSFKRWTGLTPHQHRLRRRRSP